MIEKYRFYIVDKKKFAREQEEAFSVFRNEMERRRLFNPDFYVALGGDADMGAWSVVFEDGFWLVFVGERGLRHQLSFFADVWAALSYAGFRENSNRNITEGFPVLLPKTPLA